jgi:DNA polymerase-3 subunit delta
VTPEALLAELERGRLRPAYLLAGEEALFRDRSLAAIRAAALGEAANDFDVEKLEGERATPAAAPAELAEQQQTVLVVVAAKLDKRSAWVRAFAEPAALVTCDPPKAGRAVAAFASAEARRLGIALGAGAAEALAEAVGPQLLRLASELEKAALYAGPGCRVERTHVQEAVAAVPDEKMWELTDATFEGRAGDALAALARLLAGGVAAPVLLGALASHLRKLTRAREGEAIPGHPMVVRRIEGQARRHSRAKLLAGLRAAEQADERLKGLGSLPPERVLERLVLALAG